MAIFQELVGKFFQEKKKCLREMNGSRREEA
jgi:hypothetical protein